MIGPYAEIRDALDADTVSALLEFVSSRKSRFADATTTNHRGETAVTPEIRIAQVCREFADELPTLRSNLEALSFSSLHLIGVTPFKTYENQIEIVAHGNGAFFSHHIDTFTDSSSFRSEKIRVVSAIYYFHNHSKRVFRG